MNQTPEPVAPAVRAASEILVYLSTHCGVVVTREHALAEIIERETCAGELLEALESIARIDWRNSVASLDMILAHIEKQAKEAITRATTQKAKSK